MLNEKSKRLGSYRVVLISLLFILLCMEGYVILVHFQTVNISSFDVEIAANITKIDESKKTFSVHAPNADLIRTSREYKEVLTVNWNKIVVIDTDNQLKIIDENENVLVVFKDFSLDPQYITSTKLSENRDVLKISFVENKDGKDSSIDYCYNTYTKETYIITNS
jgi:hypothetical protein